MIFNFFKKGKEGLNTLEKARYEGLITEREFLELKVKRAERELERYTEVKVKVKKK